MAKVLLAVCFVAAAGPGQGPRLDRYGDPLPPGAIARLGTVRYRPPPKDMMVVWRPDSKAVVTVSLYGEKSDITVWELETGRPLQRLVGAPVSAGAITVDGKRLVYVEFDGMPSKSRIFLLDLSTGAAVRTRISRGTEIYAFALARDGKTLAVAGMDDSLRLWDLSTQQVIRAFLGNKEAWSQLAFSPDGRLLASGNRDGKLCLWDVATGRLVRPLAGHTKGVAAVVFAPDGRTLATTSLEEKRIWLWDTATGKELHQLKCGFASQCLAFSPDGKTLVSGDYEHWSNQTTTRYFERLWDVATGKQICRLAEHRGSLVEVSFSPDGKRRLSRDNTSAVLRVFDIATGKELSRGHETHEAAVSTAAFSPDGKVVATAGRDGTIRLWEAATGRPLRTVPVDHGLWIERVAFSADRRTLASSGWEGPVRFRDVATGKETGRMPQQEPPDRFLAYSPDGRFLATSTWHAQGSVIRLWDAVARKELGTVSEKSYRLVPRPFSPDGKRMVTIDGLDAVKCDVCLWDTATRKQLARWKLSHVTNAFFSPDGTMLVAVEPHDYNLSGTGALLFLDVAGSRWVRIPLPRETSPASGSFPGAISPDGRFVAYVTDDDAIVLWEVASGQVRRRLRSHQGEFAQLAFSPDGTMLVSPSYDSTSIVWDVTGLLDAGRSRPLSREELRSLWAALAGIDAAKADQAIVALAASAKEALPFLQENLKPAAAVDPKRVRELLARLDSDRYGDREHAARQLQEVREAAAPILRNTLAANPSAEVRRRMNRLLDEPGWPRVGERRLREVRAVEVLERMKTPESRGLLQALAKGAAEARLTREAKAALARQEAATR
jgi:WD40 repeat protein